MNDTIMDRTASDNDTDRRSELGKVFAVIAAVLAAITPAPTLKVLGTEEFTNDFMWGTHTADTSGFAWSAGLAIVTIICALLAAILGKGHARTVGLLLLIAPVVLAMMYLF